MIKRIFWLLCLVVVGTLLFGVLIGPAAACPYGKCDDKCGGMHPPCAPGLACVKVGWLFPKYRCRNPDCPGESDCKCPPPPGECGDECDWKHPCGEGLWCMGGVCVNPRCPWDDDCDCQVIPGSCQDDCDKNHPCTEGLACVEGACVNPDCPTDEDCVCRVPNPCEKSGYRVHLYHDANRNGVKDPGEIGLGAEPQPPAWAVESIVNGGPRVDYLPPEAVTMWIGADIVGDVMLTSIAPVVPPHRAAEGWQVVNVSTVNRDTCAGDDPKIENCEFLSPNLPKLFPEGTCEWEEYAIGLDLIPVVLPETGVDW